MTEATQHSAAHTATQTWAAGSFARSLCPGSRRKPTWVDGMQGLKQTVVIWCCAVPSGGLRGACTPSGGQKSGGAGRKSLGVNVALGQRD